MTSISVENLSIKYTSSDEWVLNNVSFSANQGNLVTIAGSSGCGKSTLAQAILGLIPSFISATVTGEIRINGSPISRLSRYEIGTRIGYVAQYPADFTTSLLVEEEIAFPLENIGLERFIIEERVLEVLERLHISHLQYNLITELSSGELQRVALATALALKPQILILDEPMARIDPKSELLLVELLKQFVKEKRLVLAFEHRLDYLLSVTDKLILLENGFVIAQGKPPELISKMKNVDLPEVAGIKIKGNINPPLNIQDALVMLKKYLSV